MGRSVIKSIQASQGTAPTKPAAAVSSTETPARKRRKTQTRISSPLGIAGEAQVARKTLLGQ